MNFDEFVKKYNGKATDYDGGCGVQCVDLVKLYAEKVFGLKFGKFGDAHAYYDNFSKTKMLYENFTRIPNTLSFVPLKGDIMVWNKNRGGGCGHIAICNGVGTKNYFCSYDQNWNGVKKMQLVKHTYSNVYGVLRYNKPLDDSQNIKGKWKQGDKVVVTIPVKIAYREGDKYIVDSNGYQFWIHKSVIENDNTLHALGTICYCARDTHIVQVFDDQFWCKDTYMSKP